MSQVRRNRHVHRQTTNCFDYGSKRTLEGLGWLHDDSGRFVAPAGGFGHPPVYKYSLTLASVDDIRARKLPKPKLQEPEPSRPTGTFCQIDISLTTGGRRVLPVVEIASFEQPPKQGPFIPMDYLLSSTTRSFSGWVGRASCRYNFANCSISFFVTVTGRFRTNQVTFSLQGGVVSDPENV